MPEELAGALPAASRERGARQFFVGVTSSGPERIPLLPARKLRPRGRDITSRDTITQEAAESFWTI